MKTNERILLSLSALTLVICWQISAQTPQTMIMNSKLVQKPRPKDEKLEGYFKQLSDKTLSFEKKNEALKSIQKIQEMNQYRPSSKKGGVDTAGGTGFIVSENQIGLLDFYNFNKEAFNDTRMSKPVEMTKALKAFGYDEAKLKNLEAHQELVKILKIKKASSPILVTKVLAAVERMAVFWTTYELDLLQNQMHVTAESQINQAQLTSLAAYYKNFGTFVNLNKFNKLSLKNQMGLILHEGLRHIQISHQTLWDNSTIQFITAEIFSASNESLDRVEYLEGKLLDKYIAALENVYKKSERGERVAKSLGTLCEAGLKIYCEWEQHFKSEGLSPDQSEDLQDLAYKTYAALDRIDAVNLPSDENLVWTNQYVAVTDMIRTLENAALGGINYSTWHKIYSTNRHLIMDLETNGMAGINEQLVSMEDDLLEATFALENSSALKIGVALSNYNESFFSPNHQQLKEIELKLVESGVFKK